MDNNRKTLKKKDVEGINRVVHVKSGGIVIETKNTKEAKEINRKLQSSGKLQIKEVNKKNPKIIMEGKGKKKEAK